jgi:hypothetical protein
MRMLRDLDENGVGLYRVSYVHDGNELTLDSILLPIGRKDKRNQAILRNIRVKSIKKIKLKESTRIHQWYSWDQGVQCFH